MVVYDITSPASFEKARFWVKELQKHASPNINIVLVGNKKDLGDLEAGGEQGRRSRVRERERDGDGVRGERAERGGGGGDIQVGGDVAVAVTGFGIVHDGLNDARFIRSTILTTRTRRPPCSSTSRSPSVAT